jgi:hypothetical protein
MAPISDASARPLRVTVSLFGDGDFPSISAALEAVETGAVILVKPGIYAESLVLHRPVEIRGSAAADCILEGDLEPCVAVYTGRAVLRGLTLRGQAGREALVCPAVHVDRGHLFVENCRITCDSAPCLLVQGYNAAAVLRDCRVSGSPETGLVVDQGGQAHAEACDFQLNRRAAVEVGMHGQARLRGCRLRHGRGVGILVVAAGKALLEHCQVYGNEVAAARVEPDGELTVHACTLRREGLLRAACRGATHGAAATLVAVALLFWRGVHKAAEERGHDSVVFALWCLPLMVAGLAVGAVIGVIRELLRKTVEGIVREAAAED